MGFSKKGYRESKRKSVNKHNVFKEYFNHLDYYQEVAYKLYLNHPKRIETIEMLKDKEYKHLSDDPIKTLIIDSLLDELYETKD